MATTPAVFALLFAMASPSTWDRVADYITSHWDSSVRTEVHESYIVDVPIPHTVPSPAGKFKVMFYWDTYFTNLGLLRSGRLDLARSNCDALLWWIDRIGYVPNSAFVGDDNRSQPPLLCAMVRDVYDARPDKAWLAGVVPRLEREYAFWMKERTFPNGLAHFGENATDAYLLKFYDDALHSRLGLPLDRSAQEKRPIAANMLAEAESGEDFTPANEGQALACASVKLNTILCDFEANLAYFKRELGAPAADIALWEQRHAKRLEAIRTQLWDANAGLFRNRNMTTGRFTAVASLDTFYPLWAGLATPEQAQKVSANLKRFEGTHGLAQTEPYPNTGPSYQWGFPNVWPPAQWIAARGLDRYGFHEAAVRVARKYCDTEAALFAKDGVLWEKYDVRTGRPSQGEYEADPMLGWSAGAFLALRELATSR